MITRIEVSTTVFDSRAALLKKRLQNQGFKKITQVIIKDVYTINKVFPDKRLREIAFAISNPVTQQTNILVEGFQRLSVGIMSHAQFDWAIEVGFLPGVTDNVANTTREIIEDRLKTKFSTDEGVYTSQLLLIKGKLTITEIKKLADTLYNPIISRVHIKNYRDYLRDGGMDRIVPKVKLLQKPDVLNVDLEVADEQLVKIGKAGISNPDGTRRGPLALSLPFMKTIQAHFRNLGRKPTDIELESLAQTWSEHCKHTIFADPIDDIHDGLFKHFIKRATVEIRKKKGKKPSYAKAASFAEVATKAESAGKDFCVSVFKDNSGAIEFDKDYLITHKVETHNSPSALDPFGGAITGIVGVNRDTIGFGLGAKPVANVYGFCFADPRVDIPLYKGPNFTQKMLSSRRIMDGVVDGVNAGGNQSGIPTPLGFLYFDECYRGKPLVFVGTLGIIPKKIKKIPSHMKRAMPGDYIVMVGGRVGKDGIHGATFSSEALDEGSPSTAVQIGDPITQKKMSDALVKEARDQLLYHSITDNGAGGLSCSVAEMAKESGGCSVDLEKVPLKYPGLESWEIWVSESQERMTVAVPPKNWKKFYDLMKRRGVETTVIGTFTDSGKCEVRYNGKTIMDIEMQFLHFGLPRKKLTTSYTPPQNTEPKIVNNKNLTKTFLTMMERLNVSSFSFISQQYDHLVQGNCVLAPLQGRGRVNSDVTVLRPVLSSQKGVILSFGLYPTYSNIDTYHMAASSIDTAVRNVVAAGADLSRVALLDNFCWCSSDDPHRLGQLKRATQACYDIACDYQTPFISGKDSMFNDFKGYDSKGTPIKISIPPTLLVSSLAVIDDITKVISLDVKAPGDFIYILGETYDELGASEYYCMLAELLGNQYLGNRVPTVNAQKNRNLYKAFYRCIQDGLIASSIGVGRGGLAVALAKKSIGGMLGLRVTLSKLHQSVTSLHAALFSESQGRIIVTVAPKNQKIFEHTMKGNSFLNIGKVTKDNKFTVEGLNGKEIVGANISTLYKSYTASFKGY